MKKDFSAHSRKHVAFLAAMCMSVAFIPTMTLDVSAAVLDLSRTEIDFGTFVEGRIPDAESITVAKSNGNEEGAIIFDGNDVFDINAELVSDGNGLFTVQPKEDIEAGVYNETITVTVGDETNTIDVSAIVVVPVYSVARSDGRDTSIDFNGIEGTGEVEVGIYQEIIIQNTGNVETIFNEPTFTGVDYDKFELATEDGDGNPIIQPIGVGNEIGDGDEAVFTVKTIGGLEAGTYYARINFTSTGGVSAAVDLVCTITEFDGEIIIVQQPNGGNGIISEGTDPEIFVEAKRSDTNNNEGLEYKWYFEFDDGTVDEAGDEPQIEINTDEDPNEGIIAGTTFKCYCVVSLGDEEVTTNKITFIVNKGNSSIETGAQSGILRAGFPGTVTYSITTVTDQSNYVYYLAGWVEGMEETFDGNTLSIYCNGNLVAGTYPIQIVAHTEGNEDDVLFISKPFMLTVAAASSNSSSSSQNTSGNIEKDKTGASIKNSVGWTDSKTEIINANEGETLTVKMNGEKTIPQDIINAAKDNKVNLIIDNGADYTWTIIANSINEPKAVDLTIKTVEPPKEALEGLGENNITISIAHDGELGFTGRLKYKMGSKYSGKYVNLYLLNEKTNETELLGSYLVDNDGFAEVDYTHCSTYILNITSEPVGEVQSGLAAGEGIEYKEMSIPFVVQNGVPFLMISLALTGAMIVYKLKTTEK